MSFKFKLIVLILLAFFTRFIGLSWGDNHFFHPDENNMASAISRFQIDNLDPKFYAYGQFPLYLGFFSLRLFNIDNNFVNSVYILRFYSALFSVFSIGVIYLITQKIFPKDHHLTAVLLTIFSPGLIQLAHFGTTESLLILIFLLNIFFSIKIFENPKTYLLYICAGIISGLGLASKISSLIFLGPIVLVTFMNFIKKANRKSLIPQISFLLIFTIETFLLFSPYNFINQKDFISTINYETTLATGHTKVFYTTQFENTLPYLFQTINVFPYSSGIFQYVFAIIGLILLIKNWKLSQKAYLNWFLILIPSLAYFIYFGQVYTKWTRFVSPLFFLFPLFSSYFIFSRKSKIYRSLLIILACLPGLYFMKIYFYPDVRITASSWIENNIPTDSKILSEGGNVVNIPITDQIYQVVSYDFYANYPNRLSSHLPIVDYIIVPSRRVFKNYNFKYHQHLFDGSLGFELIGKVSPNYNLFLNSENAEETWSVFDHPTIRIYKKVDNLTQEQYEELL